MPLSELENDEIIGRVLRSTIGVISRRTSEAYASVAIGKVVNILKLKYTFLEFVEIKKTEFVQFNEFFDPIEINPKINDEKTIEVVQATSEIIKNISKDIGQEAGYFFIKEIKENLPFNYENSIKNLGINFDTLQLEYLTDRKKSFKLYIKNADLMKHVFKTLYEVLEQNEGRLFTYKTLIELTTRLSTEYTMLRYVTINDITTVRNVDTITVNDENLNMLEPSKVGFVIQKVIQEINNELDENGGVTFLKKLKERLNSDYLYRLKGLGVDFNVIKLNQELVIKHVLKALVDVLITASSQSYAILMMNNFLKNPIDRYGHLKEIKVDNEKYSQGIEAIKIPSNLNTVRESEIGRCLQKLIEQVANTIGGEAGKQFINKFKEGLGKAYVLRIEEMGINLHLIELKKELT